MHQAKMDHAIRTPRSLLWMAAIAAMAMVAAASGSCFFGTATNVCENGRRCNPGQVCAPNQDKCVDIDGCGNGRPDPGEICDDGNAMPGDGCSADCKSDETCGNGIPDIAETCDDGNTKAGDGCSDKCKNENCGDSIYSPADDEECDTGIVDTPACNGMGHCTIPKCGDGYANIAFIPFMAIAPEQCDVTDPITNDSLDTPECNGNNSGSDGPGSCRFSQCGDGYLNKQSMPSGSGIAETCDTGGDSQDCNGGGNNDNINNDAKCQIPICGDGYKNSTFKPPGDLAIFEQCDTKIDSQTCNGNNNENDTDKGRGDCAIPSCGDGYVNQNFTPPGGASMPEQCDTPGGTDSPDCNGNKFGPGSCRVPVCGDGYKNPTFTPLDAPSPEQCDNGSANSDTTKDACRKNCQMAFCGDGVIDTGEICDPLAVPDGCGLKTCRSSGPNKCMICD